MENTRWMKISFNLLGRTMHKKRSVQCFTLSTSIEISTGCYERNKENHDLDGIVKRLFGWERHDSHSLNSFLGKEVQKKWHKERHRDEKCCDRCVQGSEDNYRLGLLQGVWVLLLPFQLECLLFLYLLWLPWLGLPILCWIERVIIGILVLFLVLEERFQLFTTKHMLAVNLSDVAFVMLKYGPSRHSLFEAWIAKDVEFRQMLCLHSCDKFHLVIV